MTEFLGNTSISTLTLMMMCIVLLSVYFLNFFRDSHYEGRFRKIMMSCITVIVAISEISIIFFVVIETTDFTSNTEIDISDRINNISKNLQEVSQELSNIQKELEARIEYIEDLKEEAEIAENVISLSEEQVNAVQAKLNQELKSSSGRDIIVSVVIGTIFYVLGVVTPMIISKIKNKKSVQKQASNFEERVYSAEEVVKMIDELKKGIEKRIDNVNKS